MLPEGMLRKEYKENLTDAWEPLFPLISSEAVWKKKRIIYEALFVMFI